MAVIKVFLNKEQHLVVDPAQAGVNQSAVVFWTTAIPGGVRIAPRQNGLTVEKPVATEGSPAVAYASNPGCYEYDVYWPATQTPEGRQEKVVAVLIVAEYIGGQVPDVQWYPSGSQTQAGGDRLS